MKKFICCIFKKRVEMLLNVLLMSCYIVFVMNLLKKGNKLPKKNSRQERKHIFDDDFCGTFDV